MGEEEGDEVGRRMEMKGGSSRSIEMKIISCKDVKAFNMFQKLSVYAVAWMNITISDDGSKKTKKKQIQEQLQRTPIDPNGDGNPEWNHQIRFELKEEEEDDEQVFLHFNLRHQQGMVLGLLGDRTIGEVRIPLKDLVEEASSNGVVRFVSYQVRTLDGQPNGVLNLSYKLNLPSTIISTPNPNFSSSASSISISISNSNRIQYPTVEVEPVPIPLPLITTTTTTMLHQGCYWPPPPHPDPLPFWPHHIDYGNDAYFHSPLPPPHHHHHHHHHCVSAFDSLNFCQSGATGAGGMMDAHPTHDCESMGSFNRRSDSD